MRLDYVEIKMRPAPSIRFEVLALYFFFFNVSGPYKVFILHLYFILTIFLERQTILLLLIDYTPYTADQV